jgi:AraC-like DNA-binding protein
VNAKRFIDTNFSAPIDVNDIADEAYFSKYHFIREFKKIYGQPPHQYLKKVRIENAMLLLKAGSNVSDACLKVGFNSLSTFSTLFKRLVGASPSDYHRTQQEIKAHIHRAPLDFVPGCFTEKNGWREKQF